MSQSGLNRTVISENRIISGPAVTAKMSLYNHNHIYNLSDITHREMTEIIILKHCMHESNRCPDKLHHNNMFGFNQLTSAGIFRQKCRRKQTQNTKHWPD